MKVILTAGQDAAGEVHVLYLGTDAEVATRHLENPPPGIIRTALFKKPNWDKRRHFPDNGTPVATPVADEPTTPPAEGEKSLLEDEPANDLPPVVESAPETTAVVESAEQPAKKSRKAK